MRKAVYKVKWTDPALDDLAHIRAEIKALNPHAAKNVAAALKKAAASLNRMPARHPLWIDETYRFVVPEYPSYSLIYEITDRVSILTVWKNWIP